MKARLSLGLAVALVYALFSYGGIRSPDGEVMYRTAESLARDGDASIEPLEHWPGFGVAAGRGGSFYGKYGPAMPVLASPLAWLGLRLDSWAQDRGLSTIGPSHFVGDGYAAMREGRAPSPGEPHVRRSVASVFNVVVGSLAALAFLRILERLGAGRAGAIAGTVAFALGTPMLPFSGTFFSEPLVTLCLLEALAGLGAADPAFGGSGFAPRRLLVPGIWLGLALATHLTFAPWLPVLGGYVVLSLVRGAAAVPRIAAALGALGLGTIAAAAGLLAFNAARFGSLLETGRPAADFAFSAPWDHLVPLLASWGKGLFVFCPLALIGLAAWPLLIRRQRLLGCLLLGAIAVRLMLFAAFHDWHGGFGPGPRYLLPEIAVCSLAAGLWLDRLVSGRRRRRVLAVAIVCACIVEQVWLASGEVFSWCHRWRAVFQSRGDDVFEADRLYRSLELSPFAPAFGTRGVSGPALARALELEPAWFAVLTACVLCWAVATAIARARREAVAD